MTCAECRWRQYCYSDPVTWEFEPGEYEKFEIDKERCTAELLAACMAE